MPIDAGTTYIATLRATSAERDQLALRGGLERALAAASLRPPGLPPMAILCVRQLRDPLPGALGGRGDARSAAAWERAAVAALGELARHAARPAHGPVAPSTTAVLFADQVELLACLARDWCAGTLAERWWWPGLLRAADLPRAAVAAWLGAPEHAPAALAALAASGDATRFVAALSVTEAAELARQVARIFGLPNLRAALSEQPSLHDQAGAQPATRQEQAGLPGDLPSAASTARPGAPWLPWVPESAIFSGEPGRAALLGVGLLLHRAPAIVRRADFTRETSAWWSSAAQPAHPPESAPGPDHSSRAADAPAAQPAPVQRAPSSGPATSHAPAEAPGEVPALARAGAPSQPDSAMLPHTPDPAHTASAADTPSGSRRPAANSATAHSPTRQPQVLIPHPSSLIPHPSVLGPQRPLIPYDIEIETGLGGLFYLVNLGLFLGLYGDFTTPETPGIALDIWDFVALLGAELTAVEDPVWELLALLGDRAPNEAPGRGFEPPAEWRLPAEWLAPFAADARPWRWSAAGKRLRVRHPAGFLLLDLPLEPGDPRAQLRRELLAYAAPDRELAPIEPQAKLELVHLREKRPGVFTTKTRRLGGIRTRSIPASCLRAFVVKGLLHMRRSALAAGSGTAQGRCDSRPALRTWLAWLMPCVRARLGRALGLPADADLAGVLLAQPALVGVSSTRVDVHLGLASLPIAVRMAGLDRDPGWVPAARRSIAFHFE